MFHFLVCWEHYPEGKCRQNDVVLTSMRRYHIASKSERRYFDVMCMLGTGMSKPKQCLHNNKD